MVPLKTSSGTKPTEYCDIYRIRSPASVFRIGDDTGTKKAPGRAREGDGGACRPLTPKRRSFVRFISAAVRHSDVAPFTRNVSGSMSFLSNVIV